MASIKKRILQILEEKEPISFDSLAEEIKNRAFLEDNIELPMDRIHSRINEELKRDTLIKNSKYLLYINNYENSTIVYKEVGLTIKHNPTGEEILLYSPETPIGDCFKICGDFTPIENNPDKYYFVLNIDLPLRLELEEKLSDPYTMIQATKGQSSCENNYFLKTEYSVIKKM